MDWGEELGGMGDVEDEAAGFKKEVEARERENVLEPCVVEAVTKSFTNFKILRKLGIVLYGLVIARTGESREGRGNGIISKKVGD